MNYFPILVEYPESGERVVCKTPQDIKDGKCFRVLKTCYKKPENETGVYE